MANRPRPLSSRPRRWEGVARTRRQHASGTMGFDEGSSEIADQTTPAYVTPTRSSPTNDRVPIRHRNPHPVQRFDTIGRSSETTTKRPIGTVYGSMATLENSPAGSTTAHLESDPPTDPHLEHRSGRVPPSQPMQNVTVFKRVTVGVRNGVSNVTASFPSPVQRLHSEGFDGVMVAIRSQLLERNDATDEPWRPELPRPAYSPDTVCGSLLPVISDPVGQSPVKSYSNPYEATERCQ